MSYSHLKIRGAKENNLKNLSIEIPHDEFVALTGLSGSGKSSLAFSTIFAEGQRRYVETFSPYTRQFFDKLKKPDVDSLDCVRPAVAIQQRTRIKNSRSTVGSLTDINDYLRIIWSNLAQAYCPSCGTKLIAWSTEALLKEVEQISARNPASRIYIMAPVKLSEVKTTASAKIETLIALGYARVFSAGEILELEQIPLKESLGREFLFVLERIQAGKISKSRAKEAIEEAYSIANGICSIASQDLSEQWSIAKYSRNPLCPQHDVKLARSSPALFSFNHPVGACPNCKGFGSVLQVSEARCVPDPRLSIADKALQCWASEGTRDELRRLIKFCGANKISVNTPWRELSLEQRDLIMTHKSREYRGVMHWFKRLERKIYKMHVRVFLSKYREQIKCALCNGERLTASGQAYKFLGLKMSDVWNMALVDLEIWIRKAAASADEAALSRELKETFQTLISRIQYLNSLGLSYLTLDRAARTLSGGETQRVNLATALGSELVSTQFVLDEPSVGLHPRDTEKLIEALETLHEKGNSLLVVEHDLDCIRAAGHVVELGPDAGDRGGEIVYNGPGAGWSPGSIQFSLSKFELKKNHPCLQIKNASVRNLNKLALQIPLRKFVCLSGVSGSGKSTLISEIIIKQAAGRDIQGELRGLELVDAVYHVDQAPLSKTPRSNIATYSGIWEQVREIFSKSPDALTRALSKSAFSFNVDGGRCPQCKGAGFVREDMQFLSDIFVSCDLCLGKRFQPSVLEVKHLDKNIDDILNMTVDGAADFFRDHPKIVTPAHMLSSLGLGHLRLGHSLSELSGGESQRLKLVEILGEAASRKAAKGLLLIFDEPTTGLHWKDVNRLTAIFSRLCSLGHSILCVEHNPLVLLGADWLIDLGPEGGSGGGRLVMQGTPDSFLQNTDPSKHTARYLREFVESLKNNFPARRRLPPKGSTTQRDKLIVKGAKEHNLKNIDFTLPLDKVVAITGVSGSGKSTIAKDIVYAEGQRRYLDCLSPYARQFIKELKRPAIDSIVNIRPTVCVYQHTFQPTRLSTIATMSEVYNFLRLLYAKTGIQHCPDHPHEAIASLKADEMAKAIKELPHQHLRILAPVIKLKKGSHRAVFERARQSSIDELRVDGEIKKLWQIEAPLEKAKVHSIDFVLARFNPKNLDIELIAECTRQALAISGGTLVVIAANGEEYVYSLERTCPVCKRGFFKTDPEDLSFSSKRGACPKCEGTGVDSGGIPCEECSGSRLKSLGRNVRLNWGGERLNIFELCLLNASQLAAKLSELSLSTSEQAIAAPILRELHSKLAVLAQLGLGDIELGRDCHSLSTGELQRLRLSAAMGSPLSGVLYIFDEPSAGLHPVDNLKVLKKFKELKSSGNSVLIIEHDRDTILSSEYVIDVGPGGGKHGGEIVFSGTTDKFTKSDSPTSVALKEPLALASSALNTANNFLQIRGGNKNNIRSLNLKIPLQQLVTIIGVSGAGKSSLLHGIIGDGLLLGTRQNNSWSYQDSTLTSDLDIARVLYVDQSPIGRTSRSTPASYLGIWDELRKLFASTPQAKIKGYTNSYFSYNSGKGRCPECKGLGKIKLEMSFLADAEVSCETCNSKRYTEDALSVRYLGINVSETLELTFEEAKQKFVNHRKAHQVLKRACDLGLGYLTLGQSSNTLSGGECQRLKLVKEIGIERVGHTLYILDEPTTGLHRTDVERLVNVLRQLVAAGHSVITIEHDQDLILASDRVIELGPGAGPLGGKVIYQGPPGALAKSPSPWGLVLSRTGCGKKSASSLLDVG